MFETATGAQHVNRRASTTTGSPKPVEMRARVSAARLGLLGVLVPLHGMDAFVLHQQHGSHQPPEKGRWLRGKTPATGPLLRGKPHLAHPGVSLSLARAAWRPTGRAAVRMQTDGEGEDAEEGSVFGAALLFAGTAVGAGMLALPAETFAAGFWPSEASLLLCWLFTFTTSLVTLEASWFVGQGDEAQDNAGFLTFARSTLGTGGELITGVLFWFLLTSLIVAYSSKGGQLLSAAGLGLSPAAGSSLFMAFFAALAVFGTGVTEVMNRALVAGKEPRAKGAPYLRKWQGCF